MMKVKTISLILLTISLLLYLLNLRWPLQTKLNQMLKSETLSTEGQSKMKTLNLVTPDLITAISLSIFDSEVFHNSLIVQALVGNLVIATNQGRIEPSLAESWSVSESKIWTFKLKENLFCENNEPITANNFKKSLERSLKWQAKGKFVPVFESLKGFEEFRKGSKHISGIKVNGNYLILEFEKPFRTGLLEYLSMAPFGYISESNFNSDGTWANKNKFISSGPYKLAQISSSMDITLEKNTKWHGHILNSPDIVHLTNNVQTIDYNSNLLLITPGDDLLKVPSNLTQMKRVPENLTPIVLIPKANGFFENRTVRQYFKRKLMEELQMMNLPAGQILKSSSLYPHQSTHSGNASFTDSKVEKPLKPLIFRGNPLKQKNPVKVFVGTLLINTLKKLEWPYEIDETPAKTYEDFFSPRLDINKTGSEIGGGLESWIVQMLFCSAIGPRYPDPTGRICALTDDYEAGKIEMPEFSKRFNEYIAEDSCVIPILHSGRIWYVSQSVSIDNISPVVSIPRYEELEVQ
ncbi:MAG: ABC transporter substrate-binding protein [Pseudobdellovibrionaceae bacterium]